MNFEEHQNAVDKIYKYQIEICKIFGCWRLSVGASERLQWVYELYYYYVIIFWILLLDVGLFIYFVKHITDIDEILSVFLMLATLVAFLVKYLRIKYNKEKFQALFKFLRSEMFAARNPREEKLFKRAIQMINCIRSGYFLIAISALNGMLLGTASIKNFELPVKVYTPYSLENNLAFVLTYVYEFIAISIGCLVNVGFDTLCPSMLIFVKAQLEILEDRLSHLSETTNDEDDKVRAQLKAAMQFYENITELVRTIEGLISIPASVQLMCSILVLIANFYAMSMVSGSNDYAKLFGISIYQCCMLMQIFLICYFANEVTLSSLTLSQALYGANWMLWNKENRKLALLMMECYSVPLHLRSINRNYCFNLAAFTSIVNCSYSYFALLKRVNN